MGRCSTLLQRVGAALLLLAPAVARADEPIAVIAAVEWSAVREISLTDLRRIYLGRITRLGPIRVDRFHLGSGSTVRQAFSRAVLGKSELEMQDYWIEQALTGGQVPPREFRTPAEIVEAVTRRPGGLGYVPLRSLGPAENSRVRILTLVERGQRMGPRDVGYPIQIPAAPDRGD